MGRWDTGAITTGQCQQLSIKAFAEYLKERKEGEGTIAWSNGATIGFDIRHTDFCAILTLFYTKKDHKGETQSVRYNVSLISTPSNLGKGMIYYFVCPFGMKRCKVLYMGYGSLYFKSREAYSHRIYYASQLSSRLELNNDRYWRLERHLQQLYKKSYKTHYRGNKTPIQLKIEKMKAKRDYYDRQRMLVFPKSLLKYMYAEGIYNVEDLF